MNTVVPGSDVRRKRKSYVKSSVVRTTTVSLGVSVTRHRRWCGKGVRLRDANAGDPAPNNLSVRGNTRASLTIFISLDVDDFGERKHYKSTYSVFTNRNVFVRLTSTTYGSNTGSSTR